jgi:hypothetical protein
VQADGGAPGYRPPCLLIAGRVLSYAERLMRIGEAERPGALSSRSRAYSCLSAESGSTRVARLAGRKFAARATAASARATTAKVQGSFVLTP